MPMFTGQEFLRNPDRYIRLGARPPRGVLLVSFKQGLMFECIFLMINFDGPNMLGLCIRNLPSY